MCMQRKRKNFWNDLFWPPYMYNLWEHIAEFWIPHVRYFLKQGWIRFLREPNGQSRTSNLQKYNRRNRGSCRLLFVHGGIPILHPISFVWRWYWCFGKKTWIHNCNLKSNAQALSRETRIYYSWSRLSSEEPPQRLQTPQHIVKTPSFTFWWSSCLTKNPEHNSN